MLKLSFYQNQCSVRGYQPQIKKQSRCNDDKVLEGYKVRDGRGYGFEGIRDENTWNQDSRGIRSTINLIPI